MDLEVRAVGEAELGEAFRLTREAFDDDAGNEERWMGSAAGSDSLGAFENGRLAGFARVRSFGQFFGGRSVPMGGVASVAVAPEFRGRGHASALLAAALPRMRERGQVVSTLYPATTRLYRRSGWEIAGVYSQRQVPARTLSLLAAAGSSERVRRATPDDIEGIKGCYLRVASTIDGFVDRPDDYWADRLEHRWDGLYVYVVDGDEGEVDGYVVYSHTRRRGRFAFEVAELLAADGDAAAALWRVLGSSASQVETVVFHGPPEDPVLLTLPEQDIEAVWELRWMLRIVDAAGAVAARGFPPGVSAKVDLDLDDRIADWNRGRWRLTVEDGHGRLEKGGTGDVRMRVNAFASLWSGYAPARILARAGLLTASAADVATLDAAFAGPTPWMPDFF